MTNAANLDPSQPFTIVNASGTSPVLLVCEHASNLIPERYNSLGLPAETLESHVAWDIGARQMAEIMGEMLGATLIMGTQSRLLYDCNRPPEAQDAIPARTEAGDVPGNLNLTSEQRAERVETIYLPFKDALHDLIAARPETVIVTIHSFTPVFDGRQRALDIGVLSDEDTRLADAMLAPENTLRTYDIRSNEPYGPNDGVTHTLKEHALPLGLLNVMLEVRNDLIATKPQQAKFATILSDWLSQSLARMEIAPCRA